MKKLLSVLIALVMVMSISLSALAAPNGFVSSPSGKPAPELVDVTIENEDCEAKVKVTPYSERGSLSEADRKNFENAYNDIVGAENLAKLNGELEALAKEKGIDVSRLSVSDLFNLSHSDCSSHDEHGNFDVTLKADTLKNFVALLRLNNGKWEVVDGATVSGSHLKFKSDGSYPYAIVVDAGTSTPQTGDNTNVILYSVIMLVSAVAVVFLWKKSKKGNQNQ